MFMMPHGRRQWAARDGRSSPFRCLSPSHLSVDFKSLKLDDLLSLYNSLACLPDKDVEWPAVYQSVKRFMRNILKFSYLTDFQMALESHQARVNLRAPNRRLSDIQGIPAYTVLKKPDLGVVYFDRDSKKIFMRVIEANKFSDGTFKIIQVHLESRLRLDASGEVKMKDKEKELIKQILNAITYRKEYRNALRRFEIIFGIRKKYVTPVDA